MFWRRLRRKAQATTEYILIVVLVAVLSIGVITVFGNQLRDLFRVSTERLGGDDTSKLNQSITQSATGQTVKSIADLK